MSPGPSELCNEVHNGPWGFYKGYYKGPIRVLKCRGLKNLNRVWGYMIL